MLKKTRTGHLAAAALARLMFSANAAAQDKPNMLVIWGDDIGYWNISANSRHDGL